MARDEDFNAGWVRWLKADAANDTPSLVGPAKNPSAALVVAQSPAAKAKKAKKKPVASAAREDLRCDRCAKKVNVGHFFVRLKSQLACRKCAGIDDLVYLPRGNLRLERLAEEYSQRTVVVRHFNQGLKVWEFQGLLIEPEALAKAEAKNAADERRQQARKRREAERQVIYRDEYARKFASRIRERFPLAPRGVEYEIAVRACAENSDHIGRIEGEKAFQAKAIDLAVGAHIRHHETRYDDYLALGYKREAARFRIHDEVDGIMRAWREKADKRA